MSYIGVKTMEILIKWENPLTYNNIIQSIKLYHTLLEPSE